MLRTPSCTTPAISLRYLLLVFVIADHLHGPGQIACHHADCVLRQSVVTMVSGPATAGSQRSEGLGVRQEKLYKAVWDLERFGSAKCLNRQGPQGPLGSTNLMRETASRGGTALAVAGP